MSNEAADLLHKIRHEYRPKFHLSIVFLEEVVSVDKLEKLLRLLPPDGEQGHLVLAILRDVIFISGIINNVTENNDIQEA